jgi:release factor glutamine methyltransferase
VRAAAGEWFDALDDAVRFDVIVSNPPYVAEGSPLLDEEVADWEPPIALFAGADGLDAYRSIVPEAFGRLVDGGWLVLEIGTDQGGAVSRLCQERGYVDVAVRPDLAGHDRIVVARHP